MASSSVNRSADEVEGDDDELGERKVACSHWQPSGGGCAAIAFACGMRQRDTSERADASSFCSPGSPRPLLAILGVFSIESRERHRRAVRASWLRGATNEVDARFVMHGLGARVPVLHEAAEHGDIVFLRAPASLPCKQGPLRKLWLWLSCALSG